MRSAASCSFCPALASHGLGTDRRTCCWCWVVELAREAYPGHPDCLVARERIDKIRARFRTAVLAEREACARIVEEFRERQPLESMPPVLLRATRKSPETVLRAVLDAMVPGIANVIRSRIDPLATQPVGPGRV